MLDSLTIQDASGTDVPLHLAGRRHVQGATGLHGLPAPREIVRSRPGQRGDINETKHGSGHVPVIELKLVGNTSTDVWAEFDALNGALADCRDTNRLLKWTRKGLSDARVGVTNLVTNPSLETNLTGWAASFGPGSAGTKTRITTDSVFGIACVEFDITAFQSSGSWAYLFGPSPVPYDTGSQYTLSFYYKHVSGVTGWGVAIKDANGTDTVLSNRNFTASGSWQRFTHTFTPAVVGETPGIFITPQVGGSLGTIRIDGVTIEKASSSPAYFDGDTPGAQWNGTAHASTSTFVFAPGEKLQSEVRLAGLFDAPLRSEHGVKVLPCQVQLRREDPRAYSQTLITTTGEALSSVAGGMTFPATFPVRFTPSGSGQAVVTRTGNIESSAIFRVYGFASSAQILQGGTTRRIVLSGEVVAGDYLELDTFARTCKLNGTVDRENLIVFADTDWRTGEIPDSNTTFRLIAGTFDALARLDVLHRDAHA